MERQIAIDIHDLVAAEAKQWLLAAGAVAHLPNMCRRALENVQEKLHWACERISLVDDEEIYAVYYLPLFDALGYLREGIAKKQNPREIVTVCLAMIINDRTNSAAKTGVAS